MPPTPTPLDVLVPTIPLHTVWPHARTRAYTVPYLAWDDTTVREATIVLPSGWGPGHQPHPLPLVNVPRPQQGGTAETALSALMEKARSTLQGRARLTLAAALDQQPRWSIVGSPKPAADDLDNAATDRAPNALTRRLAHLAALEHLDGLLPCQVENRARERVLRVALEAGHQLQHGGPLKSVAEVEIGHRRRAVRERAGLVEDGRAAFRHALEDDRAADDDGPACRQ